MRLLLDTNVLIKAALGELAELSSATRDVLTDEDTERELSTISLAEVAVKVSVGKLALNAEDLIQASEDLELTILPYFQRHADRLFTLPLYHRDPFDRMLIATAISEAMPVITTDREFVRYREAGLNVLS